MNKISFLIMSVLVIFFAGCNNDDNTVSKESESDTKGQTSLEVTLSGGTGVKASGAATQTEENVIKNFTVYVFSGNKLEKSQTFISLLTGKVNGLFTGAKHIVVVANTPAGFPSFGVGADYSEFQNVANYILLDTQKNLTNGLAMSGEANVTLTVNAASNSVSIDISRVVAKIMLGAIIIDASGTEYDPALFELDGVAIIKAKSQSSIGVPGILTSTPFYSGIVGPTVTTYKSFLFESITKTSFANKYFYVFENDNTGGDATLMALSGTYDGVKMYYPFVIETPTKQYIRRNTQHLINITLKHLGVGSPDPESPVYPTTLSVEVIPQNWHVQPTQVVEW